MDIIKANHAIAEFLKVLLSSQEVKVISVNRSGEGWFGTAETYEESSFIKSVGLSTNVKDRNFYEVELDSSFEVVSYSRIDSVE